MTDFSFSGVNASDKAFSIIDIKKSILPPQRESTIDIPSYPGFVQSSKKFIQNKITVDGIVVGTSATNLTTKLKALASFLYHDTDEQLIFDDESDRYYLAQHIDTVITARSYRFCKLSLIFRCSDPFAYAVTADSDDQTITVVDDTYAITNSGDYYAYPVITVFFNQAQSHIYIYNTNIENNRIDISKSFDMSDELVIDCKNLTVKLNGVNSPAGLGTGGNELAEFPMLESGANTIQVGTDDPSIDIDINMTFNKAYFF